MPERGLWVHCSSGVGRSAGNANPERPVQWRDVRIALPSRIPPAKAFLFTAVLVLVELVEGTDPRYALLVFAYFMLSVFAFNVAGGFTRPSGAYIFFYSTLVAGVGTVYKALLGQAAQTHLESPVLVMSVYVGTVLALMLAAFLTRRIATSRDGVAGLLHVPKVDMSTSALGCVVMVFLINNAGSVFPVTSGSILHAIYLINFFLPLGILLGTIAAVQNSNGRRSTSPLTVCILIYATYNGILSFSKQGMFSPFVCWVLGLAWAGFHLQKRHILTILTFAFIAQTWMVPLANVGREQGASPEYGGPLAIAEHYALHPGLLRELNRETQSAYSMLDIWYYGTPQGIFDRFTMLPNDSQLISYSAQGHYFGYLPLSIYFGNWVPHLINPNKADSTGVGGNKYAHELGQLAEADVSTGISYSPSGEAFHLDGWTCVLLVQPFIFLVCFVITDWVCGDLRTQPWGLLPMLLFAHIAPEQLLGGTIVYTWTGNVGTIFAILVCGYVTPVFGRLLKGRERAPVWRNLAVGAAAMPSEAEPA